MVGLAGETGRKDLGNLQLFLFAVFFLRPWQSEACSHHLNCNLPQ